MTIFTIFFTQKTVVQVYEFFKNQHINFCQKRIHIRIVLVNIFQHKNFQLKHLILRYFCGGVKIACFSHFEGQNNLENDLQGQI